MFKHWTQRSLRSWVTLGIALTVLPLVASIVIDHLLIDRGVIADFQDVAHRQRTVLGPVQELRVLLWEGAVPVNEYLDARAPDEVENFRAHRVRIEATFLELERALEGDAALAALLGRAMEDWRSADQLANDIFATKHAADESAAIALADRFDARVAAAADRLKAIDTAVERAIERDHDEAMRFYERTEWVTAIALLISFLCMGVGVYAIGRILVSNVERLVEGARRFAAGDRSHRIEVELPPELRQAADEFNTMIHRIHESEAALAELARKDPMTGLGNRRAFDDAMVDAFARMRRLDERVHLLAIDVDHFKRVNDTYGHAAGDEVLRVVAQTLAANIREVDRAFRIGGEEFVVLLVGTDLAGAKIAAERLRSAIAERPVATGAAGAGTVEVTASLGIAVSHEKMQPADLLAEADAALYLAKAGGRNRAVHAPDVRTGEVRAADAPAKNEPSE